MFEIGELAQGAGADYRASLWSAAACRRCFASLRLLGACPGGLAPSKFHSTRYSGWEILGLC